MLSTKDLFIKTTIRNLFWLSNDVCGDLAQEAVILFVKCYINLRSRILRAS